MPRKGENIYKRKDGRWEGRYKKGRKLNGQLSYGYIYGKTYKEVKIQLYTYKIHYHNLCQQQGESAMRYEDWTLQWLSEQQNVIKASTYSTYLYKLRKYILPTLGQVKLNQLTPLLIQQLIDQWQQKQQLKPSTIHGLFQLIKTTCKEAVIRQYINKTPCFTIRLPKKTHTLIHALTRREQNKLEKEAKQVSDVRGLPILLALHTGMRIGEISALKWTNIDLENKLIYVQQTCQRVPVNIGGKQTKVQITDSKTRSSNRTIPIGKNLYKFLKKGKKKAVGPYVCSTQSGPAEPRLLTYHFHKIRQKCGYERIHFHQLRHTFATRCVESNGDITSISRLLGHVSTQTTLDIYSDSFLATRRAVIEQMTTHLQ